MGESHKLTTRSEVGTELGCFVRNLEGTVSGTALGGTLDTALLEDLGETLEATFGETLEATLGATLDANLGEKKIFKEKFVFGDSNM